MKMLFAFYKANGPHAALDDKAIAWWTKGPYSHVEIWIPKTKKRYTSSGRAKGVVKRNINSIIKIVNRTDETWDYIEFNVDNETQFLNQLEEFYNMTKDDKYDWAAIYGFVIPFKDRTNKWICSEWCTNFGKISNISKTLWKVDPAEVSPNKLFNLLKEDKNAKIIICNPNKH